MSKAILIILGLIVLVMGVLALIPSIEMIDSPMWHSIVTLVVGALAVILGLLDKKKMAPAAPKAE